MEIIDGNKKETKEDARAVFKTGIGLYAEGEDFDIMINDEVCMWFRENGEVKFNKNLLKEAGFKIPEAV